MHNRAEVLLTAWGASIPGIGPKRFEILTKFFPELRELLTISEGDLILRGCTEFQAKNITAHQKLHPIEEIEAYCLKSDVKILDKTDERYPRALLETQTPPVVLYVKGDLDLNIVPSVAVVGTRRMTAYGKAMTQKFTRELCNKNCLIVSGFMYGVDAVAHETAIKMKGKTVGVLGFGFNYMYPKEHLALAKSMLDSGNTLITEFAPWVEPIPNNFPIRNRIVSGMSQGVLVIEAAPKSGSKITANCAVDQGREVFAVPGPVGSIYSEGTKELVNLGAKLVTNVDDILSELPQS